MGVAPLIKDTEFGGLIADQAVDAMIHLGAAIIDSR